MPLPPSDLVKVKAVPRHAGGQKYKEDVIYYAELIVDYEDDERYELVGLPNLCSCGCGWNNGGFSRYLFTVVH